MINDSVGGALYSAMVGKDGDSRSDALIVGEAVKLFCQITAMKIKLEHKISKMGYEKYNEYLKRVK